MRRTAKKFLGAAIMAVCLGVGSMASLPMAEGAEIDAMQKNAASDYEAISRLVVWERQSRVRHVMDEMAACYFPDATVATSWSRGPLASYLKGGNRAEATADEIILSRVSVPVVHQKGKRAYVELPATTIRWIKVNGEEAVLTSYMRLIYRVEQRNGVWKIADMLSINEDDTLAPAVPGTDLKIDASELKGLRHSYRYLAYTRIKAGGTVSNDLLGIDRPDDIARIYSEAEAWLNEKE